MEIDLYGLVLVRGIWREAPLVWVATTKIWIDLFEFSQLFEATLLGGYDNSLVRSLRVHRIF